MGEIKTEKNDRIIPKNIFRKVVETYWWITLGEHEKELEGLSYEIITCLI